MARHWWFALLCLLVQTQVFAEPVWRGAAFAGDRAALEKLATAGANAVRVYGEADAWVLDEAHKLGLGVLMGLDVPRHGQNDANLRAFVLRYRNHPALLAWVIGNEVEHGQDDPRPAWREVDRLAGMVKTLDTHPTVMAVNDGGPDYLAWLGKCCANVDMVGLHLYAGAALNLDKRLRDADIRKPVLITELGPLGQWQAGRKPWGAPVELTSHEKADYFRRTWAELGKNPQVRGIFAFLWGAKQEQTATWHGLLLQDGSLTEMTDALMQTWGKSPAKTAPSILGIGISADEFVPGAIVSAGVDMRGEAPVTGWKVLKEAAVIRSGGEVEPAPEAAGVEIVSADAHSIRFRAPEPGAYRLFITVRDTSGKAATANLPFLVK